MRCTCVQYYTNATTLGPDHRLNLKFIWTPVYTVQLYSLAETPQLPPPTAFGLIYEGAFGQPR